MFDNNIYCDCIWFFKLNCVWVLKQTMGGIWGLLIRIYDDLYTNGRCLLAFIFVHIG